MLGRFQHVIAQAGLHCLDRDFFTPGCGNHDHRAVRPEALDSAQHRQAIRPADLVVGNHQIEGTLIQRLREPFTLSELLHLEIRKLATQLAYDHRAIIRVVVNE